MDPEPTDSPTPPDSAVEGFLDGVEDHLDTGRSTAVVLAPSPMMDDPPPDLEEPVLDGETWREWEAVTEETSGEPILIVPPSFDRETWSVTDPDAPGVTPHDGPETLVAPEEDLEAFREAAPSVPFSELTDETLEALAPDPEAQIPGTSVRWKEATESQLEQIAEGEPPSEVV